MLEFILAQGLGIVALVLVCGGYFFTDRKKFLVVNLIGNVFYALAFIVLGAYIAGILTFISLFRIVYLLYAEKYNFKYDKLYLMLFILAYLIVTIVLWSSWLDIIPLITSTLFTFGFAFKNLQYGRLVLIIPNAILVVYNIIITTYVSALLNLIEVILIVIALLKFYKASKNINSIQKQ